MDALRAAALDDDDELLDSGDEADTGSINWDANEGDAAAEEQGRARAETVNIDQIEDAALSVKIVEFFPVGEKLVYRIETNTSLTDVFQERNFTCCRKYEDFEWLHERFTENIDLAGVVVPHLPPKMVWANITEKEAAQLMQERSEGLRADVTDDFQKRAKKLERFLQQVVAHPKLREDPNLVVFLEYNDELNPKKVSRWRNLFRSQPSPKIDTDPEFKELTQWCLMYRTRAHTCYDACGRMMKQRRYLAGAEAILAQACDSSDRPQEMDRNLTVLMELFARGLVRSQKNQQMVAEAVDTTMLNALGDCDGVAQAMNDMLVRRIALLDRSMLAEKNFLKAKAKYSQTTTKEKEEELLAMESEHVATAKQFESASACALGEFSLQKKRRMVLLKQAMVSYAEQQIRLAQENYHLWGELAIELRRLSGA